MIYLLHFEPRYKHAGHYCGSSDDVDRRVEEHRNGRGARLTQVAVAAGCNLILARVWKQGGRDAESSLKYSHRPGPRRGQGKRRHSLGRYCPLCNPTALKVKWSKEGGK